MLRKARQGFVSSLPHLHLSFPRQFWALLKQPLEATDIELDKFMLHFRKVHSSWHGDAMHQCAVGVPHFEVDRKALLAAFCKVKNGKSSGNCAYPTDLIKHHKHVQLYDALALLC